MTQPYIDVSFDLEKIGDVGREKLFQIEKLFSEIGVTFDTSIGGGDREWQWDWSLSGPVKLTLQNTLQNGEDPTDEKENTNS